MASKLWRTYEKMDTKDGMDSIIYLLEKLQSHASDLKFTQTNKVSLGLIKSSVTLQYLAQKSVVLQRGNDLQVKMIWFPEMERCEVDSSEDESEVEMSKPVKKPRVKETPVIVKKKPKKPKDPATIINELRAGKATADKAMELLEEKRGEFKMKAETARNHLSQMEHRLTDEKYHGPLTDKPLSGLLIPLSPAFLKFLKIFLPLIISKLIGQYLMLLELRKSITFTYSVLDSSIVY